MSSASEGDRRNAGGVLQQPGSTAIRFGRPQQLFTRPIELYEALADYYGQEGLNGKFVVTPAAAGDPAEVSACSG